MFRPLILTLLFSVFLTTGCANKRLAQNDSYDQTALEKASEFEGDSEKALMEAEVKYEDALNSEMNFYAPLHMAQAYEALAAARIAELKGLQSESILDSAKVIILLQFASNNKKEVEVILKPLLHQKIILEQLNSPRVLPDQFEDRLDDIKDLITKVEEGKKDIKPADIESVLDDLKQLEMDTLLEIHWQPAQDALEKAEDENAEELAPKTFKFAEKLVDKTEEDIRLQYTKRELVSEKGLAALRSAQHALYVARDAEQLLKLDNESAEKAVLRFESL